MADLDPMVRARLLTELTRHVGPNRSIGMGELYEAVFLKRWEHRINSTRQLRRAVTALRQEGLPICSVSTSDGGGYYLAAATSDLDDYCQRLRHRALKVLAQEAKLRRTSLPALLGQIQLNLRPQGEAS